MSDSLSQLLKNHNQQQAEVKRQNGKETTKLEYFFIVMYLLFFYVEQLKKNAVQSTNELTDSLTEYVNEG